MSMRASASLTTAVQFGVADRWLPAAETLARGRGDCEDYALAKLAMLRRAGFADKDLYLVVLKDLSRRADHAVLVVRADGRFLVLDNGTDRIVDSSDSAGLPPVLTFTAGHAFTHGYRRDLPPVQYASNSVAPRWSLPKRSSSLPRARAIAGVVPSRSACSGDDSLDLLD